jgi:hypothetical protein
MTTHPEPRSPDEPPRKPRTFAGRDMLANHGYRRPVTGEWIVAIEVEASKLAAKNTLEVVKEANERRAALAVTRPEPDLADLTAALRAEHGGPRPWPGARSSEEFAASLLSRLRSTKPG